MFFFFFSLDVLFIVQITQIQYSKIYFQTYKGYTGISESILITTETF